MLPFDPRIGVHVLQGPGGSFSHQGDQWEAIDFELPEGTPIRAMRAGEVIFIEDQHSLGGPNSSFALESNFVRIRHSDGTIAEYQHLQNSSVRVRIGSQVKIGETIAQSGNTGFSSTPHLHVRIYNEQGSVPIEFIKNP